MRIEKPGKLKEAQNAEKIACFGLESWTPHDLRRTAATKLSEFQTPDFDIDMILGHFPAQVQARVDALQERKKMGIIATYNQYQYDREKKKYLTDWSNCLLELLSQNNIPIHLQYVAPQEPPSQE